MARIFPFQPYRYSSEDGPLENLVTQPYDKISEPMRARYLALSPHNLVRIILGERFPSDNENENVYTRARGYLDEWIRSGVLVREQEPSLYAYSQEFCEPDTGERLVRTGFIGLGAVEDYSEGVVYRHEQTLSGPKKDRLELLRHTHAHFGQLFMLYPDPQGEVDAVLGEASRCQPLASISDEYHERHSLWKISDPARIARIQQLMSDKKLLIADGHHRYETALAFRRENPGMADARNVMMTFVNMYSPGLKILATHRLVGGVDIAAEGLLHKAAEAGFRVRALASLDELRKAWAQPHPELVRIGAVLAGSPGLHLLEADRRGTELDLDVLHGRLLGEALGIGEDAVRDEKHLRYIRGLEAAAAEAQRGAARIAFLVEPASIGDVARIAFSGGVMPQKSTDFYPKLLSGLTVYKLER